MTRRSNRARITQRTRRHHRPRCFSVAHAATAAVIALCTATFSFGQDGGSSNDDRTAPASASFDPALEVLSKRSANSKHYRNGDGSYTAVIANAVIHRQDEDGKWVDLDTEFSILPETQAPEGYDQIRRLHGFDVLLPLTPTGDYAIQVDGKLIQLSANSQLLFRTGTTEVLIPSVWKAMSTSATHAVLLGERPLLLAEDRVLSGRAKVKHELVLREPSSLFAIMGRGADVFIMRDEVILPEGWTMQAYEIGGTLRQGSVVDVIQLIDEAGQTAGRFPQPVAYDENSESQLLGHYEVHQVSDNQWTIDTVFDAPWLLDDLRVYPIVIDPTVEIDGDGDNRDGFGWNLEGSDDGTIPLNGWQPNPENFKIKGSHKERSWIHWNIESIPDDSEIDDVRMQLYFEEVRSGGTFTTVYFSPVSATTTIASTIWNQINEHGGEYGSHDIDVGDNFGFGWWDEKRDLGSAADANLEANLEIDRFRVGIGVWGWASDWAEIDGSDGIVLQNLFVTYTEPSVTNLSWRSGSSCSSGVISQAEGGDTVYARVQATGMNEQTVEVQVRECDIVGCSVYQHTAWIDVPIGSTGCGTASWVVPCDINETFGYKEYELYYSGVDNSSGLDMVDQTPPPSPTNGSPSNQTVASQYVDFDWSTVSECGSGFDYYKLYIDDDSNVTNSPEHIYTTQSSYRDNVFLGPGTWYWQVRAYDNEGLYSASSVWSFDGYGTDPCDSQDASTPSNQSPSNNSQNVSITTNISWSSSGSCTSGFDVFLGPAVGPLQNVGSTPAHVTTFDLSGLLIYSTTYRWYVTAVNTSEGDNSSGSTWTFTTEPAPDPCDNVQAGNAHSPSPADGANNVSLNPSLTWVEGTCTDYNQLLFGTEPQLGLEEFYDTQTSPWAPPFELEPNTTYYWIINSINDGGDSSEGVVWSFTTAGDNPFGACCVGASCSVETAVDCADLGGSYIGHDSSCVDNPCDGDTSTRPVTTVITHGFDLDIGAPVVEDWCFGMGRAILERIGGNGSMYKYDPISGDWDFIRGSGNSSNAIVLIFDWVNECDRITSSSVGYAVAAADALFAALRDPSGDLEGVELVSREETRYLHLIGHSRGTVVNSEVARRFTLDGFPIDHVTSLDPHPMTGNMDNCLLLVDPDLNDPTPMRWEGIRFWDNYFRSDGWDTLCDPDGLDLGGGVHFNCDLVEEVLVGEGYSKEHSDVHLWYHGTVDLSTPAYDGIEDDDGEVIDSSMRDSWYDNCGSYDFLSSGYYWSRLGGGGSGNGAFGFRPNNNSTGVTPSQMPIVFNGDFENGQFSGWLEHGGYSFAELSNDSSNPWINNYRKVGDVYIDTDQLIARHNRVFIPEHATALRHSYRVENGSSNDYFYILITPSDGSSPHELGLQVLGGVTGWMEVQYDLQGVHQDLRGKTCTIEFGVGIVGWADGYVGIDNVRILTQTTIYGPCCITGICSDGYTYDECDSAGGQFQWGNDWCEEVDCDDLAIVACCMGEQCVETTASYCSNTGGVSQGYNTNCDINPCLTSGACCLGSDCYDSWTSVHCDTAGGVFQGLGSTCSYDPCPDPTGACCVGTHCENGINQIACSSVNGIWSQGVSCSEEPCECETPTPNAPSTVSSACLGSSITVHGTGGFDSYQWQFLYPGDTSWNNLSSTGDSINMYMNDDGLWRFRYKVKEGDCNWSDWSLEIVTTVVDCDPGEQTGACCSFGSCSIVTADVCAQSGGEYQGDDIDCAESFCELPLGACCTQDGNCSELSEPDCLEYGGDYEGNNSECITYPCDEVEPETGACCILGSCLELSEYTCEDVGYYQGNGTTCADPIVDCTPDPYGACCLSFVACTAVTEDDCLEMYGEYQGDDTGCTTDTCVPDADQAGACCIGVACLFDATEIACVNSGGVYRGNGSDCASVSCAPCSTDAPTIPVAPSEACVSEVITISAETGHYDYRWQSRDPEDPTWDYIPNHDQSIYMVMHGSGSWLFRYRCRDHGCDWSPWSEASSGTSVTMCAASGACCVDDVCSEDVAEADCVGTYFGDWSMCSDYPSCEGGGAITGACCTDDGCAVTTLSSCFGQFYEGATCASMPCLGPPRGACCIEDNCYRTTEANCNGDYEGDGTVCWGQACDDLEVLGACCTGSLCEMLIIEECYGYWFGDMTCDDADMCVDECEVIGPFQWPESEGGNGHWYAIYLECPDEDPIGWSEASVFAEAEGAYFTTFTTTAELNWWLETFAGYGESPYIGLWQNTASDSFAQLGEPFGGWEWITGEGLTLTNFAETAPDDLNGVEHFGRILPSGLWEDAADALGIGFAVEFGQSMNVCETCQFTTIQAAVDAASDGATIYVGAGSYTSTNGTSVVDFQGKTISLIGEGSSTTFIDGETTNSGVAWTMDVGESAKLTGFTIENCTTTGNGAAVSVSGGELTITDCNFSSNNATGDDSSGGAINMSGNATVILDDCEFFDNTAVVDGGAICLEDAGTNTTMYGAQFRACTAGARGGAIFASENTNCTLDLCLFRNNQAAFGGAVHLNSIEASLSQTCFQDNIASSTGGAVRLAAGVDTILFECLFVNNEATNGGGGAVENFDGTLTLRRSTFVENTAALEGDALIVEGSSTATITDTFFCGNTISGDVSEAGFIEPFVGYDAIGDANEFYEACTTCQGDVNGDGLIDFADFFMIAFVAAFGCDDCPEMIELLLNPDRHPCEVECPGG